MQEDYRLIPIYCNDYFLFFPKGGFRGFICSFFRCGFSLARSFRLWYKNNSGKRGSLFLQRGTKMANEITKRALEQAFLKLLAVKPFKKITVSDITSECGVNRMTFYYHFEDVYALLDYCLKYESEKALKGKYESSTWMEGMRNIFELCLQDKDLLINAYRFNSRGNVEAALDPIVYQLTLHVVKEEASGHDVSEENLQFVANCYKHLLIGMVLDWIRDGMKADYHLLLDKLEKMLIGETEWVLSKFENSH